VKRLAALLMAGLSIGTIALAQAPAPQAAGGGRAVQTTFRPPNIPNARGTDFGTGYPCDQLTNYGQAQPQAAIPFAPYGASAPTPGPAPAVALPTYLAPVAPGPTSQFGAGGMNARATPVPNAPKLPYRFVAAPQPPRGTQAFGNVNGVALLKNGRLIVNQRLPMYQTLEYTADNRLTRVINPNMLSKPHGMRVDAQDNIWFTDVQCNRVIKMNPMGEVLMTLGSPTGAAGTWDEAKGAHLFNEPTDIALAKNGDIFVSTGHGGPDPRVVRFDKTGKFITTWSLKPEDGSRANIHTIAVNAKNEVFAADREVKRIIVTDANGKRLRVLQMPYLVCGLYVDAKDQLWMTAGFDGMILRIDGDGKILGYIGQTGFGEYDFNEPHYMTISPDGKTIYVGDTVANNIKKLELIG
jgi:sugar lactone lactonase YvrE